MKNPNDSKLVLLALPEIEAHSLDRLIRRRLTPEMLDNLSAWIENSNRMKTMSNAELVRECIKTDAADWDIVNEMMTRLHPGWENEPDGLPNEKVSDERH